jgi:hypothetical protein
MEQDREWRRSRRTQPQGQRVLAERTQRKAGWIFLAERTQLGAESETWQNEPNRPKGGNARGEASSELCHPPSHDRTAAETQHAIGASRATVSCETLKRNESTHFGRTNPNLDPGTGG